ncbi:hypothetical protein EUX98_g7823 [Antrodiella citrinella]|uniref:Uncharacterized protein n=1 Tax=Antrodiella citrinella TaxID=2447956 RepID=A0A4S4ML46_9APHY|nr:hypothetical protein EUX98_g7823 [Antrodiella citrinella]
MSVLIAAGENPTNNKARVAFTASIVQRSSIDFDTLTDTPARKKLCPDARYGQSKFANVVMAREFARRYDRGFVFTSLNPADQSLTCKSQNLIMYYYPAPFGALTPLWAGTSSKGADLNGKYLIPWARVGTASAASGDPELCHGLWGWLDKQTQEKK